MLEEQLQHCRRAADVVEVFHHVTAARLEVGEERGPVGDRLKIIDRQRHVDRTRHRQQMKDGIGRTAQCHDHGDGVLEGRPGHDVGRFGVGLEQVANGRSCPQAFVHLGRVVGRDRRTVWQAHSQRLDSGGHRIGGVHATARTRPRAGMLDDIDPFLFGDPAGNELAVRLESRNDVQGLARTSGSCPDGAPVDHQRRPVDPAHRHQRPGHVLVAAGNGDIGVVPLSSHDRLDRVCNQISRLQRIAHPLGTHRDAVGNADGIEPHPNHPGPDYAFLDLCGELIEVHVAGIALVPHAGDADLSLLQVL